MRKTTIILLSLCFCASCSKPSEESTNLLNKIEDPVFQRYCLWSMDINEDGFLSEEEVLPITQVMLNSLETVTKGGVASVKGIEIFKRLTDAFISSNPNLTSMDLSKNTRLYQVCANNNALKSIDISGCVNLEYLEVQNNHLEVIDISNCPILKRFIFSNNPELKEVILSQEQDRRRKTPRPGEPYTMELIMNPNLDNLEGVKITIK